MSITPTLLESTPKVCKHGDRWNLVYVENGKQQRRYIGEKRPSYLIAKQPTST